MGSFLRTLNPPMARLMISRGLERLSVHDFRKDYPVFLDPHYPMGQCLLKVISQLRELDDRDVQSLSALLPEKSATAFRGCVAVLRRTPEQAMGQAGPALLDALWQSGLRDYVKAALDLLNCYNVAHVQQANSDKTIGDATQTIGIDPESAEAYRIRAWAYSSKHEYDKAIADYSKAIELNPKDAASYYSRGLAYHQKGAKDGEASTGSARPSSSGMAFDLKFENLAADSIAPNSAASALPAISQTVDFDRAISDYTEAIRLNPSLIEAYTNRAMLYTATGRTSRAEADMTEAKRLGTGRK
jgi:tetratricopeptide (TPR) repeat protein